METKMFNGCAIDEISGTLSGVGGVNRKLYKVWHIRSGEVLHAISLAEAYRTATLLDLSYDIYQIKDKFYPDY
jgi:hypothetical protein